VRIEPFSLIQAIAVGIGFLGSGVVIAGADNRPHGLTTAASIWAAAAIGLTAGFGKFLLSAGATVLLLIVLRAGELIERRYKARHRKDAITGE
jgi:putative Mg2+ transporter-C (MgtC) family protein